MGKENVHTGEERGERKGREGRERGHSHSEGRRGKGDRDTGEREIERGKEPGQTGE